MVPRVLFTDMKCWRWRSSAGEEKESPYFKHLVSLVKVKKSPKLEAWRQDCTLILIADSKPWATLSDLHISMNIFIFSICMLHRSEEGLLQKIITAQGQRDSAEDKSLVLHVTNHYMWFPEYHPNWSLSKEPWTLPDVDKFLQHPPHRK